MLKKMAAMVICVSFAIPVLAVKITENFEKKEVLLKMELEGAVVLSKEQKHGGSSSLVVPENTVGIYRFGTDNKFGKVTFWVYDSCVRQETKGSGKDWFGPAFGLINADDAKFVLCIRMLSWKDSTYLCRTFTGKNQWWDMGQTKYNRVEGWQKLVFDLSDDQTLTTIRNDEETMNMVAGSNSTGSYTDVEFEYFNQGFNGMYFGGGKSPEEGKKSEKFFYDDIEADLVK